ncbi:YlbF family regulator [Salipaludibacillus sp. HK11]|uniref:YlbF family regulator n=1 Tax=Salipaludibacillus sp. HK11 TaxID=3394320 RepID=UPI0039FCBDF7
MANPYDKAKELAKELQASDEFTKLSDLHSQVNEDEVAKRMLDNFRKVQMELQQKQMQGEQISEEEIQSAQQQFELVQQHEVISKLMEEEQRMSQLVGELNKIITEPLEGLYGVDQEQEG